tara:strand:- start:807 stop:932 length:126 start_codon:yes stop_codon:yes gene_type:complete
MDNQKKVPQVEIVSRNHKMLPKYKINREKRIKYFWRKNVEN